MAGWTPVPEAAASAWKPVVEAPKPAATHGDRLKGTPSGLPDTFMGTITKDFAAIPEGLYNTVTHPIDTVKGAFHQLVNLPGDVVTDISQGNWGKLAAKFGELAVPALSTERGAAMAGAAGTAVKDAAAATAGKAVEIAANPVARELIGVASPRLKNALAAVDRVKTAAQKAAAENAAAENAAPVAAEAATPGEALARAHGQDWASLSADGKGILESVARAQQNAATQPPRPPMGPPQAQPAAPVDAAPAAPSRSISQQIADEVAARKAPEPEAATPGAPPEMIGAHQVTPLESGKGAPLRPPIRRAPLPTETRAQYEAAMQSSPQSAPITTAVPEPEAPAPPPRSLAQTEAAMGQKKPAPVDIGEARSIYNENGEVKSPQQRGMEKTAVNRAAKAQRFADALHESGITAEDARQIEMGRLSDTQMAAGQAPRWGNIADHLKENIPSAETMPQIIDALKKIEKAKAAASPASKRAPGGGMGGMKNYFVDAK